MFAPRFEMADTAEVNDWLARVERNPKHMGNRVGLAVAKLKEGGSVAEARHVIDARPGDSRIESRIAESHAWGEPADAFFYSGEPMAARPYYKRVTDLATNSESEHIALVRMDLIDGRWTAAADDAADRLRRYESDEARAERVALLFMLGRPAEAWKTFTPHAASTNTLKLWTAAFVGHRASGSSLETIDAWLTLEGLENAQVKFTPLPSLYLHMNAVTDRVPGDADIVLLSRQRVAGHGISKRWAASARLVRSAMENAGAKEARSEAEKVLTNGGGNASDNFMLPLYAWVAWMATDGNDETVQEVRTVPVQSDFDSLLAKSMVLALDKQEAESLRYLNAARFALAGKAHGELTDRAVAAEYQFALSAYLMYRRTGNDAYRQRTVTFLQAQERSQPYFGWVHAMQAVLLSDAKARVAAACRAQFLDPGSYFLKLAKANGVQPRNCARSLWEQNLR